MYPHRFSWLPVAALFLLPQNAAADESFYLIVFGAQRPLFFEANHTHTFAVFARACEDPVGGPCMLESFTISWMPQALEIRVGKLLPEPGVNLDIHTTLKWALDDGQRVSRWGPYRITPELYQRAVQQRAHLESGAVRYKAVDTGFPTDRVSNCIHGVSDLAHETPRLRIGTPAWGQAASYFVTLSLGQDIVDPQQTHEWLMDALGLLEYPIVARELDARNPTARPLLRTWQSLLRPRARQSLRRN